MSRDFLLLLFLSLLVAANLFDTIEADEGTATYYKRPYTPSACYQYQDNGVLIAGASDTIWDNRAACGRMYNVRCTRAANGAPHACKPGAVTVKIVDYCPPPYCNGTINLSQDAFSRIADLNAGRVIISYYRV